MGTNEDWEKIFLKYKNKRMTRGRSIKLYCRLQCCAGDTESWKKCPVTNCLLHRYRTGKEELNHTSKKELSIKKSIAYTPNLSKNEAQGQEIKGGGI